MASPDPTSLDHLEHAREIVCDALQQLEEVDHGS